jgi:enoyl-CoA hydratase/carnithine racemase
VNGRLDDLFFQTIMHPTPVVAAVGGMLLPGKTQKKNSPTDLGLSITTCVLQLIGHSLAGGMILALCADTIVAADGDYKFVFSTQPHIELHIH